MASLSALSLCFALRVLQHHPPVLVPAASWGAKSHPGHRAWILPALSPLLAFPAAEAEMQQVCAFRCRPATGTADPKLHLCAHLRGARQHVLPQNHPALVFLRFPPPRHSQLHPCGERPSSLPGMALRVPAGWLTELRGWDQPPRSPGKGSGQRSRLLSLQNQPFSWKRERL